MVGMVLLSILPASPAARAEAVLNRHAPRQAGHPTLRGSTLPAAWAPDAGERRRTLEVPANDGRPNNARGVGQGGGT